MYKYCTGCGVIVRRVPAERLAALPGPAGREKSQHRHRSHVRRAAAAPPCGRRGERQGGAAGQRDAVLPRSVHRRPV